MWQSCCEHIFYCERDENPNIKKYHDPVVVAIKHSAAYTCNPPFPVISIVFHKPRLIYRERGRKLRLFILDLFHIIFV